MSLAPEPESRRGLIPLAAAWLLVLGLVAAAAVFVLLERQVTAQRDVNLVLALPAEPAPPLEPAEVTVEALPKRPATTEALQEQPVPQVEWPAETTPSVAPPSVAPDDVAILESSPQPDVDATPEPAVPAESVPKGGAEPLQPTEQTGPTEEETAGAAPPGGEATGDAPAAQDGAVAPGPEVARLDLPAWRRYSNARDATSERPRIAVVITGLGQSAAATEAAIKRLPPGVTLSFTPYARQLNQWIALARVNQHEIMLDLPMEPVTFPEDDPGPHALLTVLDTPENLRRLDWLLNRGNSYVGVTAVMGSRFTASELHVQPILAALKERGLLYLDNAPSPDSVADSLARQMNLPHVVIDRTLDSEQASRLAINARLNEVERLALEQGFAVAIGQPYPVTIERVGEWGNALAQRGFDLVPITALANVERQRPSVAVEQ